MTPFQVTTASQKSFFQNFGEKRNSFPMSALRQQKMLTLQILKVFTMKSVRRNN